MHGRSSSCRDIRPPVLASEIRKPCAAVPFCRAFAILRWRIRISFSAWQTSPFGSSSRKRASKLLRSAVSQGEPGAMQAVFATTGSIRSRSFRAMNPRSLSDPMNRGGPRWSKRSVRASGTSVASAACRHGSLMPPAYILRGCRAPCSSGYGWDALASAPGRRRRSARAGQVSSACADPRAPRAAKCGPSASGSPASAPAATTQRSGGRRSVHIPGPAR